MDRHTGIFRFSFRRNGDQVVLSRIQVIPCQTSGSNDYRPVELTEEEERKEVFRILSPSRESKGFDNPPAYFLENGMILFDEAGNMKQELTD